MSANTRHVLDTRLFAVLEARRAVGDEDSLRSLDVAQDRVLNFAEAALQYGQALDLAPRLTRVGHLVGVALDVMLGRPVCESQQESTEEPTA